MKCGLFGCRGDDRGLARQTQTFAKHLLPARMWAIDMHADGLSPYENDWTPFMSDGGDLHITTSREIHEDTVRSWMRGLDVVLAAETFYKDEVITIAREEGVRTVIQYNPEFAAWHINPSEVRPDLLINPTTWRSELLPDAIHLPCPVDRELFPFRLRTSANRFVHVAGHRAMADRAGTRIVMSAVPRIRDDYQLIVRSQSHIQVPRSSAMKRVLVEYANVTDPALLYDDADVVIIPRRYGGQSLAMNEALSMGAPVICLDRTPENIWRGTIPLPARHRGNLRTKGGTIPVMDGRATDLVEKMKTLYDDPTMVERLSHEADSYAQSISWDALLGPWNDLLAAVVDGDIGKCSNLPVS